MFDNMTVEILARMKYLEDMDSQEKAGIIKDNIPLKLLTNNQ